MILITGDEGYIGSILKDASMRAEKPRDGIKVFLYHGIDLKDGLNLLTCDLPERVDTIYHLAAQSSVEASHSDPLHDLDNIRMTARLVKEYPNARIIYANSAAAIEPIMSPYGFSKWASAEYLKRFHKDYVICTFPNVYGRNNKSVVDIFKASKDVTIFGDGLQTRDYVHVDDIVEALIKAPTWPTGEYELGSGRPTTVLELAEGKNITFMPPRKEARESILKNTTPNWFPVINVMDYLND